MRNFIIEHIEDAVMVLDMQGCLVDTNPAMRAIFKISEANHQQPLQEAIPEFYPLLAPLLSKNEAHQEIIISNGNQLLHFDMRIMTFYTDQQENHRVVFLHKVTRASETQEQLRQSEGLLRAIVETTADAIITIDSLGKIVAFNPAATRIFGYSSEEVIGQNVKILMPEPTASQHDGYLARRERTGETKVIGSHREEFGKRKDGSIFPIYLAINEVFANGRLLYTGLIRDVTEHKRIEHERNLLFAQTQANLAETEAHAHRLSLLNEMSQNINIVTTEDEIFEIAKKYITQILPLDHLNVFVLTDRPGFIQTVVNEGTAALFPANQAVPYAGTLIEPVLTDHEPQLVEDISYAKTTKRELALQLGIKTILVVPVLVRERALGAVGIVSRQEKAYTERDQDLLLHIASFLGIAIENVRRTKQLQEAMWEADAANHAKSEFLATISHELRTPLNGILGYVQILEKDKDLTPKQADGLAIIQRSGEHLLTLINDILDLSKIEARRLELGLGDFHLLQMLENVCEIFKIRAEQKGIEFRYEIISELPTAVHGDEIRLRQVLINLLANAVKFTDVGGVVFKVGYHEGKIRFQVEDTGIGIVSEMLKSIFDPFKQVDKRRSIVEGTGLGLAISHRLVRLMGGSLQVKSELNMGSTFWFELKLPEVENFVPPPQTVEKDIRGYRGSPRKVLVVDDRWENRSVLTDMLLPLGFLVREASDGNDSLRQAALFKPDVILMDLQMPGMDGLEATRRLRQLSYGKNIIIIVISASAFEHNREESRLAGADDFLAKPFRLQKLLDMLQMYLRLEWIYDEEKGEETSNAEPDIITPPSQQELVMLLDLARQGDVRGISAQAEKLSNQGYVAFARELQSFSKNFKIKELREFINSYKV